MELSDNDMEIIPMREYMTELEKTVINNDYNRVSELISKGHTIFIKDRLCNGYMIRKNRSHHICLKNICNKTAVYYAFYINNCIMRRIIYILKELSKRNISNNDTPIPYIECTCRDTYTYYTKYRSTYHNYINNTKLMEHLINKPTKTTKNLKLIENLINFGCIHDDIKLKEDIIVLEQHIDILYDNYKQSNKIVKLLLDQQAYEIYKYYIQLKWTDLGSRVNDIYDDEYLDIGYVNQYDNTDIFTMTLKSGDNDKAINNIITKTENYKHNVNNMVEYLLKSNYTRTLILLINKLDSEDIKGQINIFRTSIFAETIDDNSKIEITDILVKKNIIELDQQIIYDVLNHKLSNKLIPILSRIKDFSNYMNYACIMICVNLLKTEEFDIVLKNCSRNVIKGDTNTNIPLIYILKTINYESNQTIKLLETLLKYEIDVNTNIDNNLTALMLSINDNKIATTDLLLNYGADAFLRNSNGDNSLHISLKKNHHNITKRLISIKTSTNGLINELDGRSKSPLIIALETKTPLGIIRSMIEEKSIDLSNMDIMNYILDTKQINNDSKYYLIKLLLDKDSGLLTNNSTKPLVVKAVELELYHIVVLVMNTLIKTGDIDVNDNDIIEAINKNKFETVKVKDTNKPNFYPLVVMYLKQNIKKYKQLDITKIETTSPIITIDKNIIKRFLLMKIFLILILTTCMIEKIMKTNK